MLSDAQSEEMIIYKSASKSGMLDGFAVYSRRERSNKKHLGFDLSVSRSAYKVGSISKKRSAIGTAFFTSMYLFFMKAQADAGAIPTAS